METACSKKGTKKLLQAQAAACHIPMHQEGPHELEKERRDYYWRQKGEKPKFLGKVTLYNF